jgi:phenylacetate-CoA ligase
VSALGTYRAYRRLQRSQWSDPSGLRRRQEAKLRRLLDHAWRTVPYHRYRLERAGVTPADIHGLDDLARLPVTTKADLQAAGEDATLSSAFDPAKLVREHTSGSTGRPFTAAFDRAFVTVRKALFLRVLATAGYRLHDRLMLITSDRHKPDRRWPPWRYASIEAPPEALMEQFDDFRPSILYGCLTPLRQMALLVRGRRSLAHPPKAVVSTAEGLDPRSRQLLEAAFAAPVYDAYGLTEVGMIAWQCATRRGYHLAEDTAIVEFLPGPDGAAARMIVTNLELMAMPLIRFETGDLAVLANDACPCGRQFRRIRQIEGRAVDCIRLATGRLLSPYRFTLALESIADIQRYQLIQDDINRFVLRVEAQRGDWADLAEAACSAIRGLVGPDAVVNIAVEANLDPPPGQKFRVVECRLGVRASPDGAASPLSLARRSS